MSTYAFQASHGARDLYHDAADYASFDDDSDGASSDQLQGLESPRDEEDLREFERYDSFDDDSDASCSSRWEGSSTGEEEEMQQCQFCRREGGLFSAFTGVPLERELCDRNIVSGSKVLLWVIAMFTATELLLCIVVMAHGYDLRELVAVFTVTRLSVHYVIQLATTASLTYCVRRPLLFLYLVTVSVWVAFHTMLCFFIPLRQLQPLVGQGTKVYSVDATGYIGLHGSMGIMVLIPLLIPEYRFISCFLRAWMGLFVVIMCVCLGRESQENSDVGGRGNRKSPIWMRYQFNFDLAVGLLVLSAEVVILSERKKAMEEEMLTNSRIDLQRKEVSENMFKVLRCMLPSFVMMPLLKDPGKPLAYFVDHASILFIMFVDFDQIVRSTRSPAELLDFLNRYFTKIDGICTAYGVTKIETVGDTYVCATGVGIDDARGQHDQSHKSGVGQLMQVARKVLDLQRQPSAEEPVVFQMGIHSGPVVAGVVGQRLPRFRLFGDTINTAARMMQKGVPGKVQFGEATRKELPRWVEVQERGLVEMKGKGWVNTYLFQSGRAAGNATGLTPTRQVHHTASRQGIARMLINCTGPTLEPMVLPKRQSSSDGISFEDALKTLSIPASQFSRRAHPRFAFASRLVWSRRVPRVNERDFRKWFHKTCFCKNLGQRVRWQTQAFMGLTGLEIMYMLSNQGIFSSKFLEVLHTFRVFLTCRLACIAILLAWLNLLGRSTRWIRRSPRRCQMSILFSWCVVLALAFTSYYSLPFMFPPLTWAAHSHFPLLGISRNPVYLGCFPMSMLLMRSHPFTFTQSCIFPAHMMLMILLEAKFELHHTQVLNNSLIRAIFCVTSIVFSFFAYLQEANLRDRHATQLAVTRTHRNVEGILYTLMPPMVVHGLRADTVDVMPQHQYSHATVVQSDLVGFTQLASTRHPEEVVRIIGDLFGLFDKLADKHGIYKVETVGDAYIAGSAEAPLTTINSPLDVALFGLEMVEVCLVWSEQHGEDVSCRVGVHTGECVGGIVGQFMQRYHLFGALMTALGVLEATAPPGKVQVSGACKQAVEKDCQGQVAPCLPSRCVAFRARPERELLTSKGEVHSLSEVGGPTFILFRTGTP